jgi:hypothetical protein
MPNNRFDWHEHIKEIEREYNAVRFALDRLISVAKAGELALDREARKVLPDADRDLQGTYIVRLFASFEAALRSYDRAKYNDPNRERRAALLIDSIGGRRWLGISSNVREDAHLVRNVRNYWAHEKDELPASLTIHQARRHLQLFLSRLPEQWG